MTPLGEEKCPPHGAEKKENRNLFSGCNYYTYLLTDKGNTVMDAHTTIAPFL